jgi:hypothetical protein
LAAGDADLAVPSPAEPEAVSASSASSTAAGADGVGWRVCTANEVVRTEEHGEVAILGERGPAHALSLR